LQQNLPIAVIRRSPSRSPVTHQPASRDKLAIQKKCWDGVAERQDSELLALINEHEPAGFQFSQGCESVVKVSFTGRMQDMNLQAQGACCQPANLLTETPHRDGSD
jgi:hypothetical protein